MTEPAFRALCVSAHPDDVEFGCAGTLATWADEGAEVTMCIVTDGSTGTQDRTLMGEGLRDVRRKEAEAAARVIGADEVVWLDYRDGYVECSLDLRRDIAAVFRRVRPHRYVVMDPTPTADNRYVNHPDHRAVGQASLDVVLTAGTTPGHFPELLEQGLEPWRGLRELYMMGPGNRPVPVDISSTIDRKIQALLCHRSQVGDDAERISGWLRRRAADLGGEHGLDYAEVFQVIVQGPGFHPDEWTDEIGFEVLVPVEHDPRAAPARRGSGRAE
jgi:LmbE family N-acetylglucosaminyl deacetylase